MDMLLILGHLILVNLLLVYLELLIVLLVDLSVQHLLANILRVVHDVHLIVLLLLLAQELVDAMKNTNGLGLTLSISIA